MRTAALPPDEAKRLATLHQCGILDTEAEPDFDALVALAAELSSAPMAFVNLIDAERQWVKANVGLALTQTPRDTSFCTHTVALNETLVVPDTRHDVRFHDNPHVTGAPGVRAYAGVPLRIGPERHPVGTLCVVDTRARAFDGAAVRQLTLLARQVAVLLEARRSELKMQATMMVLQQSEARMQALLAAMHDGMVMHLRDGTVAWQNEVAARMFSFGRANGPQSVEGSAAAWDCLDAQGAHLPQSGFPVSLALSTGKTVRDLVVGLREKDEVRWVKVTSEPLLDPVTGEAWAAVSCCSDVTEDRRQRRELEAARDDARAATESKSRFLAAMSHELRTPINGVIGMTELMLEAPDTPAKVREKLEVIHESGRALISVVNEVLEHSRLEAGARAFQRLAIHPAGLASRVVALLDESRRSRDVALALELSPQLYGVWTDRDALRQVLMNLLGNALKFTARGAVRLCIEPVAGACRFSVVDSGIGMSPEALERIFTPYTQADATISRRYGGTGLGLSISRRLVAGMGGALQVDSREGAGTTFWFDLPLVAQGVPLEGEAAPRPEARGPAEPLRLLVVEDNRINQHIARGMLERLGHSVEIVGDGVEGVQQATSGRFDAVLMDLQMPRLDGLSATRAIRALPGAPGRVPIIALTAASVVEEKDRCLEAGMTRVLGKPLTLRTLEQALVGLIAA